MYVVCVAKDSSLTASYVNMKADTPALRHVIIHVRSVEKLTLLYNISEYIYADIAVSHNSLYLLSLYMYIPYYILTMKVRLLYAECSTMVYYI